MKRLCRVQSILVAGPQQTPNPTGTARMGTAGLQLGQPHSLWFSKQQWR